MEHLVQDAKQNVLNGFGNDWPQSIGYWTPVFIQILIGALLCKIYEKTFDGSIKLAITRMMSSTPTQHFNTIKQIIQSKFQSADLIFNPGAGYIVENMSEFLVQMRFREHRDVHIFYK